MAFSGLPLLRSELTGGRAFALGLRSGFTVEQGGRMRAAACLPWRPPAGPARKNRKDPIQIEDFVYTLRNRIERCFNKLRSSRRLATRYDKSAESYLGFIHRASIRLWFRHFVNSA
ncbi:hypothetical protein CW354_01690 [Marinicaulis flavus]|uniref:Uncharacterized protein n=1 Tax=Hyphococcus luteus TaxID=2058213 RepID=A0A2S7KAQ6_9PROT|nr:hypothetical protein CW354_01690 [Marinicaulis flavus]